MNISESDDFSQIIRSDYLISVFYISIGKILYGKMKF